MGQSEVSMSSRCECSKAILWPSCGPVRNFM